MLDSRAREDCLSRYALLLIVCSAAWASTAGAGLRTNHLDGRPASQYPLYGLAQSKGYGAANPAVLENGASAMCVDCHTASPVRNANPDVALFPATYPHRALRAGSHFAIHFDGTAVRLSQYTEAARPLRTSAWPSGGRSKFAKPAPPAANAASVNDLLVPTTWDQRGELICESCHSLVRNVAGGNNLLETSLPAADPSLLCQGCHTIEAGGPPGHHPLTGDTVAGDPANAVAHALTLAHVRATPSAGSEVTYTAAGIACLSCHEPHGAQTQTGARCLNRGASGAASVSGRPVNVNYYANRPDAGDVAGQVKARFTADVVPGVDRQFDLGLPRLVTNADPVCDACHTYNDN